MNDLLNHLPDPNVKFFVYGFIAYNFLVIGFIQRLINRASGHDDSISKIDDRISAIERTISRKTNADYNEASAAETRMNTKIITFNQVIENRVKSLQNEIFAVKDVAIHRQKEDLNSFTRMQRSINVLENDVKETKAVIQTIVNIITQVPSTPELEAMKPESV